MTAQEGDRIVIDKTEYPLFSNPLEDYWSSEHKRPPFQRRSTGCWRGYIAHWEITGDRLYLAGIRGNLSDGEAVTLPTLFPGARDKVEADWFSGTLRIPQGEILRYLHGGYASTFELDILIEIKEGVVVGRMVRNNRGREPDRFGLFS